MKGFRVEFLKALFALCLVLMQSCDSGYQNQEEPANKLAPESALKATIDTDTFELLQKKFVVISDRSMVNPVWIADLISGDTVYTHHAAAAGGIDVIKSDQHGLPAVIIHQLHNNREMGQLICFDSIRMRFVEIPRFDEFGGPEMLERSNFWYSEEPTGCHGENWESTLFIILDFQIIELANMKAFGCASEENPRIEIFKYHKESSQWTFVEHLKDLPQGDQKDFILAFWQSNLETFKPE